VKYLRHPLLLAWIAITVALAALLISLGSRTTAVRPSAPILDANVSTMVATFSLDYADLGPAGIYGGQSWKNIVTQLESDAQADAKLTPPPYSAQFTHIVAVAKLALTDDNENERFADVSTLSAALDRLTVSSGAPA
jgi:hypothetical protein